MRGRRSVLAGVGTLLLGSIAGCTGDGSGGDGSVEGLEITSQSSQSMAGDVVIQATVENTASSSEAGTLLAEIDVEGGRTHTRTKHVALPAGETGAYQMLIGVDLGGSTYEYDLEIVPPRTDTPEPTPTPISTEMPIPTDTDYRETDAPELTDTDYRETDTPELTDTDYRETDPAH